VKPRYRLEIPPHVGNAIRHLPPEVKQTVKEAMRLLASDPDAGEPLRRDLEGLWKYRARRFRIVYAIHRAGRVVQTFAVGHRRTIYEEVAERVRQRDR